MTTRWKYLLGSIGLVFVVRACGSKGTDPYGYPTGSTGVTNPENMGAMPDITIGVDALPAELIPDAATTDGVVEDER